MDALAGLLDGPRAAGAFTLRCVMDPPWAVSVEDRAPLSLMAAARGTSWVTPRAGTPAPLRPGDVAVARGPDPYVVGDDPATVAQATIGPGQECSAPGGEPLEQAMHLGVRTWGNDPGGSCVLLVGTYASVGAVGQRLLDVLPPLLVLGQDEWDASLLRVLADETVRDRPGQAVVLDRLLDLVLVAVLRAWLARADAPKPGWYGAMGDPVVGHALRLVQHQPAHPWTVATLAAACGVSRATLARRFTELVGEPPMAFLATWRLDLAADLLREPGRTVEAVARRVGYGSAFALSAAFKRERGVSPREHRAAVLAARAAG